MYETYAKTVHIEAQTMIHMAGKHYIPTVIQFVTGLANSINAVKAACPTADVTTQQDLLTRCSDLLAETHEALADLEKAVTETMALENVPEMANAFHDRVIPAMAALRSPVDELELLVDKDIWPVPTYGDLMFEV